MTVTVIVAEDEAIIRLDLKESLEDEGYEVVADTGRGDEAIELIRRHKPDVAILDIKMPGLDGIETARQVSQEGTTAVVVLTAFSQRALVEQARDAGALAYLVKPFQRSELVPAVEIARARHREMRALAAQTEDLTQRLETRKLLDRAKGTLIDVHAMTEADAFAFIQRQAMSDRRTMAAVAADVLAGRLVPGQDPASP